MSIFGQKWIDIVWNTFSDFSANKNSKSAEPILKKCFFYLKSAFFVTLRLYCNRTKFFTAKPMVVGCVQHYSTHFVNKLGKSLERFFLKGKQIFC